MYKYYIIGCNWAQKTSNNGDKKVGREKWRCLIFQSSSNFHKNKSIKLLVWAMYMYSEVALINHLCSVSESFLSLNNHNNNSVNIKSSASPHDSVNELIKSSFQVEASLSDKIIVVLEC